MNDVEHFRKIDQIFQSVLDVDPAERITYMREACEGDVALISEIEQLLASDEENCSLLDQHAFDMAAPLLARDTPELHTGDRFGKYRIISLIGVGGMGHVYLAEDRGLKRKVALKLLPTIYTRDTWRLTRFEQEAQSASALNHPNILTIHEFGNANGQMFIATEFVEGETLRERLRRGPITLPEVLNLSIQISAALAAAHKAGIVHRDIKPENIMLRHDGYVKVLDFGLAKLTEQPDPAQLGSGAVNLSISSGLLMGTVKYMSPEQARGRPVDARSDIFSLGVVIYEMLAGSTPFVGETSTEMIAATLEATPPDIPRAPAALKQIIARALSKKREDRYETAADLTAELARVNAGSTETTFGSLPTSLAIRNTISTGQPHALSTRSGVDSIFTGLRKFPGNYVLAACGAGLITVIATFGIVRYWAANSRPQGANVTRVPTAEKARSVAISPSGEYIAYAEMSGPARPTREQSLWVENMATRNRTQIRGPEEADYTSLTYSNDGSYIFYTQEKTQEKTHVKTRDKTLYRISAQGGDPERILSDISGAISFSPDGSEFAFIRSDAHSSALTVASVGGGERELMRRTMPEYLNSDGPGWSPDGKTVVVAAGRRGKDAKVHLLAFSLANNEESQLVEHPWNKIIGRIVWHPDGNAIMCAGSNGPDVQIWKVLLPSGERHQITTTIGYDYTNLAMSADGTKLTALASAWRSSLWMVPILDPGKASPLTSAEHDRFWHVALGPDRSIVYASPKSGGGRDLWTMNADGLEAKQLTKDVGINQQPEFSTDGRFIVFSSDRGASAFFNIWRMNGDGSDPVQVTNGNGEVQPVLSPDNKWIVYSRGSPYTSDDQKTLWKVPFDGGEPVQLIDKPSGGGNVSPDGKTVAFWIKPEEGEDAPMLLAIGSIDGGPPTKVFEVERTSNHPARWGPDGRHLYYILTSPFLSNIWRQPVDGTPPEQVTAFTSNLIGGFDISEDGSLLVSRRHAVQDVLLLSSFD